MSNKYLSRCVDFAPGEQLAGKTSWRHLANEWFGGLMSWRPPPASTSAYHLCLVSLLAICGPGAALGFVTVRPSILSLSGPGAALVPVTICSLGAALGHMTVSGLGVAQVPVTASRLDMRPLGLRMKRRTPHAQLCTITIEPKRFLIKKCEHLHMIRGFPVQL